MRTDLTSFQHTLLVILTSVEESSGRQLKQEVEETVGNSLPQGRLYRNLDTLVEKGLVEKGRIDGRTNAYRITDDGAESIRERFQWEREYIENDITP